MSSPLRAEHRLNPPASSDYGTANTAPCLSKSQKSSLVLPVRRGRSFARRKRAIFPQLPRLSGAGPRVLACTCPSASKGDGLGERQNVTAEALVGGLSTRGP